MSDRGVSRSKGSDGLDVGGVIAAEEDAGCDAGADGGVYCRMFSSKCFNGSGSGAGSAGASGLG